MEERGKPCAIDIMDRLPIIILSDTLGNIFFINFLLKKENPFLNVTAHINIVKANIIKNLAFSDSQNRGEKQMNNYLYKLIGEKSGSESEGLITELAQEHDGQIDISDLDIYSMVG